MEHAFILPPTPYLFVHVLLYLTVLYQVDEDFFELYDFFLGKSDDFMRDVFRWFGSYLAWIPDDKAKISRDGRGRNCGLLCVMYAFQIMK
jgi:hypothetical protein